MAKKLNSMRFLDRQAIAYEVRDFPDVIRSATDVAAYLGVPLDQVYKTLVVMLPTRTPILVLVAADREIAPKRLAHALGVKQVRLATQKEAEAFTGLKVGGISALALPQRRFPVYIDQPAASLETIWVSAGQRGVDLRLSVADLCRVTGATFVEATALATAEDAQSEASLS